ncbi:biotin--[acetyl-CoA-carboxylase] ligase [Cellulomonas endophytica]|uniref:biotin--[acetyl-CoA-carboxylase] ligase n=1 Tax=Cellulomonas endophytica TaxID=2494735 RepID=UPI00101352A3|nr:biotin--[acetyl-CoA-carboxylase] ligase [Cellulomonas endophytica]
MTDARDPLDAEALRARLAAPAGPLARLEVVGRAGSTNEDLAAAARADAAAWPAPALLVADHQSAGRGRAGRGWSTPPGAAVTASLLVRPAADAGLVPLVGGLAAVRALADVGVPGARLKWPNDVLLPAGAAGALAGWGPWRKVGGVLAQVVPPAAGEPGPPAVVLGVGLNVDQGAEELPVPHATSLRAAGARVRREDLLVALVLRLDELLRAMAGAPGEVVAAVAGACATLGESVRVDAAPGSDVPPLVGRATALRDDGALLVETADGTTVAALSGDVHHVRTGA